MHANKGVYALLLGSGTSRSAQIPTGWDIVQNLVEKIAVVGGYDPDGDPIAWYSTQYGEAPNYSKLLQQLGRTQYERNLLIRQYFEPTSEDREQGTKRPTDAHAAIAELVASGYIRVILTTNFDHLIEDELRARSIEPTVVTNPDGIAGALPLVHAGITIYKLHGDYLDTRSVNTQDELEAYDPRVDALLDRVFDDFGLIVCGWSADWDTALRHALERCRSRRFATYWIAHGKPQTLAQQLIIQRQAEVISGFNADTFFRSLAERIAGLEECAKPHPMSVEIAIATVKRYLSEDRFQIRLFDLATTEADRLFGELSTSAFAMTGPQPSQEIFVDRVHAYEANTEMLLAMIVAGCFWSGRQHDRIWQDALFRVSRRPYQSGGGYVVWQQLSQYPALLLLYGAGIAAVAGERYETLRSLFDTKVVTPDGEMSAALGLNTWHVVKDEQVGRWLPGMERHHTPISDHLYETLREPLRPFLPDDHQYIRCFDRFEYLLGLVHVDQRDDLATFSWGPVGSFGWRHRHSPEETIMKQIDVELDEASQNWPPLRAGLFRHSLERLKDVKSRFDQQIDETRRRWY
jgi:hypothetical protein